VKAKKLAAVSILAASIAGNAQAGAILTGDTKLACEAIICLSTGQRPTECMPSLSRYFSISYKKWKDTLKGRINFLNLCPAVAMDTKMSTLVNDIANGAGRCDAASINAASMVWDYDSGTSYIANEQPKYCKTYNSNSYTDLIATGPKYVGDPDEGGYWVDAADYAKAKAEYDLAHPAAIAKKKFWK